MPPLQGFEIWTDLACASGSRLAAIPDVIGAAEIRTLLGEDELTLSLRRSSPAWSSLLEQRVVRVAYTDGSFDEWRIVRIEESRGEGDALAGTVVCAPVLHDLASRGGLVGRTEASGLVGYDFELLGLTPSALVAVILGGAPAYFSAGTITPTAPTDFAFNFDSPLSALQALAKLTGHEMTVRRNASAGYLVDLIAAIGSSAATSRLLAARNLKGIRRTRSVDQQVTRIFPHGAGEEGETKTIARATWRVKAISAATYVALEDPAGGDGPAQFADQFNGAYLREEGGTLRAITDTVVTSATESRLYVATTTGFSVGDLVEIRLDSAGADLTWLEDPANRALYGVVVGSFERSDLPPVNNLVANPQLTGPYGGNLPANWSKVGAPTTSEETSALYTRRGGKSCKVIAALDGEGLISDAIGIAPSAAAPFFSGYFTLLVTSGRVRVELVDVTNGRNLPDGTTGKASSSQTGAWTDLGLEGTDLNAVASSSVKMQIVADGGAATFYVDSCQLTPSAGQQSFYAGCGPRALWQAANEQLGFYSAPVVTLDVDLLDLERFLPALWPYEALVLGGTVEVHDSALLGGTITTRIQRLERALLTQTDTKVVLSSRPEELLDAFVRPRARTRKSTEAGASIELTVGAHWEPILGIPGWDRISLSAAPVGASIYYIVQAEGDAVPVVGKIGGDGEWAAYGAPFSLDVDQADNPQLSAYCVLGARTSRVFTWILPKAALPTSPVSITENPGGTAVVSWAPDADVAFVRLYRKKNGAGNGWPTTNNNVDGPLDEAQLIGDIYVTADGGARGRTGTPLAGMSAGTGQGGTIWSESGYVNTDVIKVIIVPLDRYGNPGARATAARTMTGAASARLTSFSLAHLSDGLDCITQAQERVSWATSGASDGGGIPGTHNLKIYRSVNGGGWELVTTIASPVSTTSWDDTAPNYFYLSPLKGGEPTSVRYKGELVDAADTVLDYRLSNVLDTFDAVLCGAP